MTDLESYKTLNTFYITKEMSPYCLGYYYEGEDIVYVRKFKKRYSLKRDKEFKKIINIIDFKLETELASIVRLFLNQNIEVFYDEVLAERMGYDSPYIRPSIWLKEMYSDELQQQRKYK